jgi:hypothetical protein
MTAWLSSRSQTGEIREPAHRVKVRITTGARVRQDNASSWQAICGLTAESKALKCLKRPVGYRSF